MATTRAGVASWVVRYERLWRTAGTDGLNQLFTPDAVYSPSPWAEPVRGIEAIAAFWEAERAGADEVFTLAAQIIAVSGTTGVVRVSVDYASGTSWRDLWVVTLTPDGRCRAFEEWPFAPDAVR